MPLPLVLQPCCGKWQCSFFFAVALFCEHGHTLLSCACFVLLLALYLRWIEAEINSSSSNLGSYASVLAESYQNDGAENIRKHRLSCEVASACHGRPWLWKSSTEAHRQDWKWQGDLGPKPKRELVERPVCIRMYGRVDCSSCDRSGDRSLPVLKQISPMVKAFLRAWNSHRCSCILLFWFLEQCRMGTLEQHGTEADNNPFLRTFPNV